MTQQSLEQSPNQQFFGHVGMEPMLPGFNQYCSELMCLALCLAQGHNTVPLVGIKSKTSGFGVQHSTIMPPRTLFDNFSTSTREKRM